MIIERVQVDDGFLDGLDLRLAPGLNVIIGGRGTGKTSVIELIRFCLAIQAQTSETESRALEHALSVLGDGRVTVTLSNEGDKIIVSRTAAEEMPEVTEDFEAPALFSQKEIESLGLSAAARIALLDMLDTRRNSACKYSRISCSRCWSSSNIDSASDRYSSALCILRAANRTFCRFPMASWAIRSC